MNGPKFDVSHNYQHARRSKRHQWSRDIDPIIVHLGCLVHDIGNPRYVQQGELRDEKTIIFNFLVEQDVPVVIACQVACLCGHISHNLEMHDQEAVANVAKENPAFSIIQDAVRLDDLGTIGVTRILIDRGVDETLRHESIDSDVALIDGRLSHYPTSMKTETGKKIAEKRYAWMIDVWLPQFWKETVAWSV
ncbi:hypothetical protein EK21DRAFT_62746 [Setomelanomma holmii]|uniref:HD domain-containing protein n=1 Tax=Setomelanomma holmii TaxID=210430 RepID=A0A9P4HDI2_9PLEO|nr:hypothetical protein EK21DRAFT_62746 [Setomelanomma holmii]